MNTNTVKPRNVSMLTYRGKQESPFSSLVVNRDLLAILLRILETPPQIVPKDPNVRVTISADMYVEDDEDFGSNETVKRQKTNSAILSQKGLSQSVMDFEVRMGGEIRIELSINASLIDANGNIIIDGEIKLFEGTSESTGDLDGVRQFQLYCPIGANTNYFVRVNNDDEGGDFATVRLTISNTRI